MKSNQIEKLGALASLIGEARLRASGGAESLAWSIATRGGPDDTWNQRFGIEGIWGQIVARFPLSSYLAVATLGSLGIGITGETRFGEVLDAAAGQGLRLCPYGAVPLLLASGIRLAPTGSKAADAYRRVVACTDPIGSPHRLFALRSESDGSLCACGCYGDRSVRVIELFSDEGLSFGGVPADNPERDLGFLFLAPENPVASPEATTAHATWSLDERGPVAAMLEAAAALTRIPTSLQKEEKHLRAA